MITISTWMLGFKKIELLTLILRRATSNNFFFKLAFFGPWRFFILWLKGFISFSDLGHTQNSTLDRVLRFKFLMLNEIFKETGFTYSMVFKNGITSANLLQSLLNNQRWSLSHWLYKGRVWRLLFFTRRNLCNLFENP